MSRSRSRLVRVLVASAMAACAAPRPSTPSVHALADADGDGVEDAVDACPREPGPRAADPRPSGCPAAPAVTRRQAGDPATVRIFFALGSSEILPEARPTLDAAVALLASSPELGRVEIAGHASSNEVAAQALSERRAKVVMAAMSAAGIDANRLSARGYGASRPLGAPVAGEDPARDRRVELRVLDDSARATP